MIPSDLGYTRTTTVAGGGRGVLVTPLPWSVRGRRRRGGRKAPRRAATGEHTPPRPSDGYRGRATGNRKNWLSQRCNFTGKYVLHCHMMNHEESGMMQVVEAVAMT